jgi:hypothetical protein
LNQEFNNIFKLQLNANSINLEHDIEKLFNEIAINSNLLHSAGIITPYEFLRNILINLVHNRNNAAKGIQDYFHNPCQHGVEARSPYRSDESISVAPKAMFHILGIDKNTVRFVYTTNNTQRIKLYLLPGFLENNFIYVNALDDMSIWHPVITRQLELRLINLIPVNTLISYKNHMKHYDIPRVSSYVSNYEASFDASINPKRCASPKESLAEFTTNHPLYSSGNSTWKNKMTLFCARAKAWLPGYSCFKQKKNNQSVNLGQVGTPHHDLAKPELDNQLQHTNESTPNKYIFAENNDIASSSSLPLSKPSPTRRPSSKRSNIMHAGNNEITTPKLGCIDEFDTDTHSKINLRRNSLKLGR